MILINWKLNEQILMILALNQKGKKNLALIKKIFIKIIKEN